MCELASKIATFEQFLTASSVEVSIGKFVVAILLVAICSYILSRFYVKYGRSISNRERFSENFVLLATATTLIITIVKSSLALSLGLVGALSIVRFRAAIKEPEELLYLFFVIALGLGFGANQFMITVMAFFLILILVYVHEKFVLNSGKSSSQSSQNLHVVIKSTNQIGGDLKSNNTLEELSEILSKYTEELRMKRFDSSERGLEVSYMAKFSSFSKLSSAQKAIAKWNPKVNVSYLERS